MSSGRCRQVGLKGRPLCAGVSVLPIMRALRGNVDGSHERYMRALSPCASCSQPHLESVRPTACQALSFPLSSLRDFKGLQMLCREYQPFDAWLPHLEKSIRIGSIHDASIFARRWVIRDKDPALKTLVRRLNRANSADSAARALHGLQQALASRNLLTPPSERPIAILPATYGCGR